MEKPKKHSLDFEKPLHALELQLEEIQKSSTVRTLIFHPRSKQLKQRSKRLKERYIPTFRHGKKYNCPGILTALFP